ncbi:MAG: thermonuclease family protein [Candidatus Nitrosotenuis sp.]
MARFKIFWGVTAAIVFGFIMTSLFANPNSSFLQNNSATSDWTENIEDEFMKAYNSTISEHNESNTDILDPCKMRESFGDIGISKCGEPAQDYECGGSAGCISGTVNRIIDGDTIIVDDITVRFALASAPELSEPGGMEAKKFIEDTCPIGSKVILDVDDGQKNGSYGRTLAKIYCDGKSLNEALVANGFGYIDTKFCSQSEFAEEEWSRDSCQAQ